MKEKVMSQEDIDKALDGFFRFYEDGFEETRPAYEKIIGAFVEAKVLPEGTTLEDVIKQCKKIDAAEVVRTGGKVKESNIGLQGFFASLGYTEDKLGKKGLKEAYMLIGEKALKELGETGKVGDGRDQATIEAAAFLGSLAAGPYFPRQTCFSASHFMSEGSIMQIGCSQGKTSVVAMTTYEQLMAGKKVFSTSSAPGLVPENYDEARDFYEKMGITNQFCSISQNENTNEDHIVLFNREQDEDGIEIGKSTKYEIRKTENGIKIFKEDGKDLKEIPVTEEIIAKLGLEQIEGESEVDFEASIKTMMATKGIIMGDTITLGKYQDLMPERDPITHTIPNAALIVDEADAEILDTQPQEILGRVYGYEPDKSPEEQELAKREAEKRWDMRELARDTVNNLINEKGKENITKEDLASLVSTELPLDFIADAYEATKFTEKNSATNEFQYEEKDGKIFILNPNTNVMIPASQGLSQAIIASDEKLAERHSEFEEREVLGETDIPKLFSNFGRVSLMSGTMQDKGMSEEQVEGEYSNRRSEFFAACCNALALAAEKGVIDWKLVTPKTREEKGNAIVTTQGVKYNPIPEQGKPELETIGEIAEITNWRDYINDNKEVLEDNWRASVQDEAQRRSRLGQPVMVSIYGDRNPMEIEDNQRLSRIQQLRTEIAEKEAVWERTIQFTENGEKYAGTINKLKAQLKQLEEEIPIYTAQNQKDTKKMFVDENGLGEIACFDDFYGRGYTFKFIDEKTGEKSADGGHVLITSLPQNSRNLEQFLFRVARGGDKGSSSIIISPTDPILVGYLEKLEEEKGPEVADAYFQEIISGSRTVDEIVADIYPEETKTIFEEKIAQLETRKIYDEALQYTKESIDTIQEIGQGESTLLSEKFAEQYRKEILKQVKLDRLTGTPKELEEQLKNADKVVKNTVKNIILENPSISIANIVSILPVELTEKELEEIIPDTDKRGKVAAMIQKIDRYIEKKNGILEKDAEETRENISEGRSPDETLEMTKEDVECNLDNVEKVLLAIREQKMNYKEQKMEEKTDEGYTK